MKNELFYYWKDFCLLNALLCALAVLTMLLFPQLEPTLRLSTVINFFSLPLITSQKMKTKFRYRFLIAVSLFFILELFLGNLIQEPLRPTLLHFAMAGIILGLCAWRNGRSQQHKKG